MHPPDLVAAANSLKWTKDQQAALAEALKEHSPEQVLDATEIAALDLGSTVDSKAKRVCTSSVHYRKRTIGIGMHWKGQRVTVVEATPDHVVVIHRATGAVLRELTLGPIGTYHSNGRKRGRPRKNPEVAPPQVLSAMS